MGFLALHLWLDYSTNQLDDQAWHHRLVFNATCRSALSMNDAAAGSRRHSFQVRVS